VVGVHPERDVGLAPVAPEVAFADQESDQQPDLDVTGHAVSP
jgi:hypothetical protein